MLATGPTRAPQAQRAPESDDAFLARLEALARTETRVLASADARRLVDLAVKLARGRGADDLRVGEGLARLRHHDLLLGYNGVGDLALGELGIDPKHGCWLASMAGKLASRPVLSAAVRSGEVSLRKADAVVDVAKGEHEAYWVARAKLDTVRDLERAARDGPVPADTDWRALLVHLDPGHREHIEYAFAVAAVILDEPDAARWRLVEALSMEYVGQFPPEKLEDRAPAPGLSRSPAAVAAARAVVESSRPRNTVLEVPGTAGPTPASPLAPALGPVARPRALLRELKALVQDRIPDDERLGRACILVRRFSAWLLTGARSLEAFWVEHLGLAPSTVRQRVKLEVQLRRLPPLREALRSGRLSYEQARAVARVASPADVERRIEEAAGKPALDTKRAAEEESDRQMWRAGRLEASVPERVDALFQDALRAARLCAGSSNLTPSQALFIMSVHFTDVWEAEALRLLKAADPVKLRDRGRCQVPGCSHRAEHLHHVRFRSRGGSDDAWNLVAVCTAHHLAGIHQGFIAVSGTAPDGLVWEFPGRDIPDPVAEA